MRDVFAELDKATGELVKSVDELRRVVQAMQQNTGPSRLAEQKPEPPDMPDSYLEDARKWAKGFGDGWCAGGWPTLVRACDEALKARRAKRNAREVIE